MNTNNNNDDERQQEKKRKQKTLSVCTLFLTRDEQNTQKKAASYSRIGVGNKRNLIRIVSYRSVPRM